MNVRRYEVGGLDQGDDPYVVDHERHEVFYYVGCVSRLNEYEARVRELQHVIEQFKERFALLAKDPVRGDYGDPTNAVEFLKTLVPEFTKRSR